MAEGDATAGTRSGSETRQAFGQGFLTDIWYFAALATDLKPGSLKRYEILGQPVMLGRTRGGEAFALRDICPHRAVPLSAGRLVAEGGAEVVECPYHGWKFRTDGACAAIPSLVDDQGLETERIRVCRYPVAESQGMVWIWMSSNPRFEGQPPEPPPTIPGVVPGPYDRPRGCLFNPRCPRVFDRCYTEHPELFPDLGGIEMISRSMSPRSMRSRYLAMSRWWRAAANRSPYIT